jgi:hypothetical protein
MKVTKLTQEAFDITSVRNAYLKDKGDELSVTNTQASTMSRAKYEDMFGLVQYGTEIHYSRLFSPEVLWNDVKLMEVPAGWPGNNDIDDGEGGTRRRLLGEYTRIVRSLTDPTKAMLKYGQATVILEYEDEQTLKPNYNWLSVNHELLMLFYNLFGGFSTYEEAQTWRDINVGVPDAT